MSFKDMLGRIGKPLAAPTTQEQYDFKQYGLGFATTETSQAMQNPYITTITTDNIIYSAGTLYAGAFTNQAAGSASAPPREFARLTTKDLCHAAFDTDISVLVNLWLQKYGAGWIVKEQVLSEEFYCIAAQRLVQVGRMEQFTLADTMQTVLRILDKP